MRGADSRFMRRRSVSDSTQRMQPRLCPHLTSCHSASPACWMSSSSNVHPHTPRSAHMGDGHATQHTQRHRQAERWWESDSQNASTKAARHTARTVDEALAAVAVAVLGVPRVLGLLRLLLLQHRLHLSLLLAARPKRRVRQVDARVCKKGREEQREGEQQETGPRGETHGGQRTCERPAVLGACAPDRGGGVVYRTGGTPPASMARPGRQVPSVWTHEASAGRG